MERPPREENLNTATHALATVLALIGTGLLLVQAFKLQSTSIFIACLVYGVSLVGVFASSTMSHWAKTDESRRRFRMLDQAFIYLMIVATYTPFSVAHLSTTFWWLLLAAMWIVAIVGFVRKFFLAHRVDSVSVLGYVALGWMPALGGLRIFDNVPTAAVWGIVGGGVLYTVGTLFLMNDKKVWYFHAIWHVFVMAAAAVHWWTTMTYVV